MHCDSVTVWIKKYLTNINVRTKLCLMWYYIKLIGSKSFLIEPILTNYFTTLAAITNSDSFLCIKLFLNNNYEQIVTLRCLMVCCHTLLHLLRLDNCSDSEGLLSSSIFKYTRNCWCCCVNKSSGNPTYNSCQPTPDPSVFELNNILWRCNQFEMLISCMVTYPLL